MDINRIMKTEQNMIYISEMRPVFNRAALFSDTTENYISPAEPEPYSDMYMIRFRTSGEECRPGLSGTRRMQRHSDDAGQPRGRMSLITFTCAMEVEQDRVLLLFRGAEAGKAELLSMIRAV